MAVQPQSAVSRKPRNPKGTVSVEDFQGRVRLRWFFSGKRVLSGHRIPHL